MATIAERIAELEARKAAAKAAQSALPTDKLADLAKLRQLEAEARELEDDTLDKQAALWLDEAQQVLPSGTRVGEVITERGDVFIVKDPGAKAYAKYEDGITKVSLGDKGGIGEVRRALALAGVYSWNGDADLNMTGTKGPQLVEYLKQFPAIATSISHKAGELAGIATRERKS